jgi:hypothetical protein
MKFLLSDFWFELIQNFIQNAMGYLLVHKLC